MTPLQQKALQALINCPTKKEAAAAAGIAERTLRSYMQDPEFKAAYKQAFAEMLDDASLQAKQSLSPAIQTLRSIAENEEVSPASRISAARFLLEYGLQLTKLTDILERLEALERGMNGDVS